VADARLTAPATVATFVAWALLGCGAPSPPAAASAPSPAPTQEELTGHLPRFRSKRLHLSIPLPDGRAWRVDDHSQPELVATHAPTSSRVVVSAFNAGKLVGRAQCEDLARERKLVPTGELRVLEDETTFTQGTYDTRIEVALAPQGPDAPLLGHVMAFGGFLRKCYVFVYSSEVASPSAESVLAARLALARSRMLGGLELDPFDSVTRDPEGGPSTVAPPR
jgi:hypothetical protein